MKTREKITIIATVSILLMAAEFADMLSLGKVIVV